MLNSAIEEIKSLAKDRNFLNEDTIVKMAQHSLKNEIVSIYSEQDYIDFLKNYEEISTGVFGSLTGDYFIDNPFLGSVEIDNYHCICY